MNKYIVIILLTFCGFSLFSQKQNLSLKEAIQSAQKSSPSYFRAINLAENRYWNYRQFRASLLPQLNLSGSLPNYSSAIEVVNLDDGTFGFAEREQLFLSTNLSIDQSIPLTGGILSLSSSLQRSNVYSPTNRTSYFSTPISLSYFQPMFLYNDIKWNKQIQPIAFEESQRAYTEDLENIANETTSLYFQALSAAIGKQIAEKNLKNNDTIIRFQ